MHAGEDVEKRACKLIQPLWRTVWRFLKKLGIKLPYDSAIPLLGIYPVKTIIEKDTCSPMFIAALFTIARTQKQLEVHQQKMDKEAVVCIYNGILLTHKKNEFESFKLRWMNLESVIQSEASQKNKYHILTT